MFRRPNWPILRLHCLAMNDFATFRTAQFPLKCCRGATVLVSRWSADARVGGVCGEINLTIAAGNQISVMADYDCGSLAEFTEQVIEQRASGLLI